MKTRIVVLVFLACVALVSTGCVSSSTNTSSASFSNQGEFGEHVRTPAKDFQTAGLVFTEVQLTTTEYSVDGQVFTYQALLKEAQKLGADAIINVVIDKKSITTSIPPTLIETWYGSALAIKYTTTLTTSGSVISSSDGTTTTQTSSVYFNEGATGASSRPATTPSSILDKAQAAVGRGVRQ